VTQLVWYAAYGSNLSRTRFDCYIKGGRPDGAQREYPGCRDRSAPESDLRWELDGGLVFGKESRNWTGHGVAFLDVTAGERVHSRLYLVTHEQFEDIAAQENHFPVGHVTLPSLSIGETHDLKEGFYPLVVCVGEHEGHLVMSVTDRLEQHRKPSPEYLRHIAQGLRETHHMSAFQIADYLAGRPGIAGEMSADDLLDVVRSG
jgi:hypothetical protein